MSNFFKVLLGSCLGTLLALVALVLIGSSVVAGLASSVEETPTVSANSILTLDLTGFPELTGNEPMDNPFASFSTDEKVGLHDALRAIKEAADDDDIKGIFLNNATYSGGFTKLRSVREAIEEFKESGKFVIAYSPFYEQGGYYLSSVADEIYMGPLGVIDFRGLGAEVLFYKNMLDKIGVKFEIFWAGDYKSATEPLRRTDMSDANREQTREFLGDLFSVMLTDISESRGISSGELYEAANRMTGWREEEAVSASMIDGIRHRTEIDNLLHDKVGFDYDEQLNTIDISKYFAARLSKLKGGGDREIAVLIAEGGIVDGAGDLGGIGDKKYVNELEALADDDDVKAVVLRVNSGGGSASSSENIWYAVEQLKKRGKPVVVSMGDVAASGGYYVAAGADSIFAEPTTITGSIGVFMAFPNMKELANDKIGITTDTVNTARNATALSTFRDLGDEERQLLNQRTESIYTTFLSRVAEGRNMPLARVKEIAGGRVYSGTRALELGLVDRLAGLDAAIASAAKLAGLEDNDDFSVGHYPKLKPVWESFLEELMGEGGDHSVTTNILKDQLGPDNYEYFRLMRDMTQAQKAQARMPLIIRF